MFGLCVSSSGKAVDPTADEDNSPPVVSGAIGSGAIGKNTGLSESTPDQIRAHSVGHASRFLSFGMSKSDNQKQHRGHGV